MRLEFNRPRNIKRDNTTSKIERNLNFIKSYTIPQLHTGKEWYIFFNAFDPESGKMKRKRIKVNRIKSITARRKYAKDMMVRISEALAGGWNPFISELPENLVYIDDAKDIYCSYLKKMLDSGMYREETFTGYYSKINNLWKYIEENAPITYLYQLDKKYLGRFLNHIFLERDNSGQTHNNYLSALKHFCGHLIKKGMMETDPTAGLEPIPRRMLKKNRSIIPQSKLAEISQWLRNHDKRMLLACYILYYCFIRPVEMTRLRIRDFRLKEGIIVLSPEITKNKQEASVTLPRKIVELMLDLEIFRHSGSEYLFSDGLLPGRKQINTIIFRHRWDNVRTALRLPACYQFYSLKDSGITEMLRNQVSTIDVRDQARHSSLAITDIYTARQHKASEQLKGYDGSF